MKLCNWIQNKASCRGIFTGALANLVPPWQRVDWSRWTCWCRDFVVWPETPGGDTQNRGCLVHFVQIRWAFPFSRSYLRSYELGIAELQSTFNVRIILKHIGTVCNSVAQCNVATLQLNFKSGHYQDKWRAKKHYFILCLTILIWILAVLWVQHPCIIYIYVC